MDGTYVNRKGMAQRSERALRALGDARPAWELVARLGRALGYALPWKKLADVHRAMAAAGVGAAPDGGKEQATPAAAAKPEATA
jgi:NADH-quinone oxidoreductase subunit G